MLDMGGSGISGAGRAPPSATRTGTFRDRVDCNVAATASATSASRSKDANYMKALFPSRGEIRFPLESDEGVEGAHGNRLVCLVSLACSYHSWKLEIPRTRVFLGTEL